MAIAIAATRPVSTGDVYSLLDTNGNTYEVVVIAHLRSYLSINLAWASMWEAYCRLNIQAGAAALKYKAGDLLSFADHDLLNPPWKYKKNDLGLLSVILSKLGRTYTAPAIPAATSASGSVLLPPNQVTTVPITFSVGPLKERMITRCKCPSDHPHNEKGCYYGMCSCRVKKVSNG